jgi:hypothetical protein
MVACLEHGPLRVEQAVAKQRLGRQLIEKLLEPGLVASRPGGFEGGDAGVMALQVEQVLEKEPVDDGPVTRKL